jgi:hypothetical protein
LVVGCFAVAAVVGLLRYLAEKAIDRCSDKVVQGTLVVISVTVALGIGFTLAHAILVYAAGGES